MINLQDTFNDSPSFRSEIVDTERLLSFIDEVVRNLVRAASAVSAAQETLRIAEEDLASWLRRLGTVEDSLEENLEEIARGISGLAGARESLTLQIGEAFLRPLDDYETTVVESTKKLGRDHVAAREAYEKALARYLEKPASTANDVSEAAADDVAETNYQRHKQALRYCRHLNDRESRQKYEVIDGLLVFLFSYTTFHHAAHEMLSEAKTGMDHLSRKVQLQTQQSADKPNDDQIESKYLSAAVSRYNPETSDFLQPTSPSTTQMAGYLYKRPIQTLRNAWSPWNRRWFVCDITSSTLYYIRPDGSDADKKSIDLRTAMVRVARDVDRRHCFEIVCPNRTYMLQAENKDAMKSWIDCLQKANARALFLHRPPEQRSGASAVVDRICSVAGNDRCADCGAVEPTWASISFGVTLCIECSGVHRNLGRVGQVSKIRSLTLDHWTPETVDMMVSLGNQKVNAVFEALLGPRSSDGVDLVRPAPKADRDVLERYITNKYVAKQFVRDMDPEDTVETLTQQLWEAMDNMDLPKAMQLLAWGASVQMRNGEEQGGALIHHVTRTSSSPVALEFTLLQGGEIDAQDDLGFSALHHAIALSKLKMAIVLLRRGASLHLRDVNGTTVMDVAEEKQDPSCLTLIRAISQGLMTVDQAEEMLVDTAAANESSAESMSDLVATNHVVVQEDHVAGHGSTDDGSDL